ncbi:putative crossover junction endodeoxyribonuclease RusA [Brevibacillus phage Sundance]|uniref:RusA family crossover junction endodeoxyribonuclease n=1 Tax=Brevibacillus phage Sundance TaxID=1691958 RepID=UPI0006BDF533|nr:RusA family crossover junction endodeoxyribonuclease [Brevibacillus phage Sundance]ALA47884.1 putative crossover junction endodeoxyribonuclease RusA [Brevibacillus phage Sundance]
MQLKLTLPMPVSINKLYINEYQWDARLKMRVPTGRRILSKEGRQVKAKIQGQARVQTENQDWDFDWTKENFVYQDAVIFFARRGSDDNNIYKLLNDSLEGIAYDNDSRVLVRTQHIVYDSKNPRIELTLVPVEFVGIFKNQEMLRDFQKVCESCSRYRKGSCSIIKNSIAGTVREEIGNIYDPRCTQFKEKK